MSKKWFSYKKNCVFGKEHIVEEFSSQEKV